MQNKDLHPFATGVARCLEAQDTRTDNSRDASGFDVRFAGYE